MADEKRIYQCPLCGSPYEDVPRGKVYVDIDVDNSIEIREGAKEFRQQVANALSWMIEEIRLNKKAYKGVANLEDSPELKQAIELLGILKQGLS